MRLTEAARSLHGIGPQGEALRDHPIGGRNGVEEQPELLLGGAHGGGHASTLGAPSDIP
ncbi:hypothetical protein [Cryobacterium sp. TMT2-23]|uniref:hypothetical protein n=1 Tax=Cryobacterium sp. TMT2-23 TaxID=1259252 RepID=UPI00141BEF17|nr:hypothetical protein [Cryobacterium sp. TMT2-23]